MRISNKQLEELKQYTLTSFQIAVVSSLVEHQKVHPQLTSAQEKLFTTILKQVKTKHNSKWPSKKR